MMSQNLMDFAFQTKKEKHKTITLCLARGWKSVGFRPRTNHGSTVRLNKHNHDKTAFYTIGHNNSRIIIERAFRDGAITGPTQVVGIMNRISQVSKLAGHPIKIFRKR